MSNLYAVEGGAKPEEKDDRLDIELEMLETIRKMDVYAWNKGKIGGLDWGNKSLNEAFDGLQSGLILLAGQPNVGKSAMCIQLGWQIAQANTKTTEEKPNKAYVLYFSLDDNAEDLLPRVIAIDQRIPINAVKAPKKYEDNLVFMTRRNDGIKKLKEFTPYFKIVDSRAGSNIEHIEQTIKEHQIALSMKDETYKLVVIIDNFHDISVNEMSFRGDGNAKYDYIAGELSRICTHYDIPVICTAEFRKLNGTRRPTPDDLRETVKIQYEAKAIILCYNEVGIRGEAANIFWNKPDSPYKQPVLELKIGKNKYSSFKNRIYMEFMPEMSFLKEASEESSKKYNQMILA